MEKTGRDLDFALEGRGFFVVDTPQGTRYTRNGNFSLSADGTVTTADGHAVQTAKGPLKIGKAERPDQRRRRRHGERGRRRRRASCAIVDFGDYYALEREDTRSLPRAGHRRRRSTPDRDGARPACSRPPTSRSSIAWWP